ncbi:MAG TPA: amidohydrolase [Chloroflexus aurantiacus]|jgi:5-methylthioadenosine/S-adenosylhomocysteine deaminase|uniref:5-methylthioadenosine/S-adenosylhomocysteine deaminase n=1 Tax=Chloroflexus aurantiacus (strain ATCC 29366 / DSM 635 / J-10-fl) TaxID=324602 RepID=A9WD98_CHLAA|nr:MULTISPECIES: amidohydrolase [Chloroflexus]ABY35065.1 amidohydrolase [Chloroflexus aurantiacus J-10-fl]RMG49253.1 MAG: amidohydrolase [Chloroflexota bacterium]GIV92544.1 MAG: 5-methylthioadenosine/S-adenosylhomocysteine deaminase [Chloroflexus sp.]HBW66344.1 amidohydrolase [Chloroflexus aurantiacus]
MYDLLVQRADVLQIANGVPSVLPQHDIAITDRRIVAIAPDISPGLARETLAADGLLAIPGLINSHSHTAMSLFRGVAEDVPIEEWFNGIIWPLETNLTPEDVYWGTLLGLAEMIEAGVTCVADHYFAMDAIVQAVQESGMRALLAWTIFSGADEHEQLSQARQFVEQWHGAEADRIRVWMGPHSPYTCTPSLLRRVAQTARELGVGIHIHLSETAAQVAQSLATHGCSPVSVARNAGLFDVPALAAHVAHVSPEDIATLAAHGVAVAVTPKTEMKLGIGVAPTLAMREAGVTVALGSDGAASNNTYDILESARLLALLEKLRQSDARCMPIGTTLELATGAGARALQWDGIGVLQVGARADLALVQCATAHTQPLHNPAAALLYSSQAADVDTVIVDGRILMHRRTLLTIDKPRVLREVAARIERLTQRQGERRIATYPEAQASR